MLVSRCWVVVESLGKRDRWLDPAARLLRQAYNSSVHRPASVSLTLARVILEKLGSHYNDFCPGYTKHRPENDDRVNWFEASNRDTEPNNVIHFSSPKPGGNQVILERSRRGLKHQAEEKDVGAAEGLTFEPTAAVRHSKGLKLLEGAAASPARAVVHDGRERLSDVTSSRMGR